MTPPAERRSETWGGLLGYLRRRAERTADTEELAWYARSSAPRSLRPSSRARTLGYVLPAPRAERV